MKKKLLRFLVLSLLVVVGSCTKKSTDLGDSTSDQQELLAAYDSLLGAFSARDSVKLAGLVSDQFNDEGVRKVAFLQECGRYFQTYTTIKAGMRPDSLEFSVERDRALVRHYIRLVGRKSGSVDSLVEIAHGDAQWIREDGVWRLYGDQQATAGAGQVTVAPRADEKPLEAMADLVGTALSTTDLMIACALWDTLGSGHSALEDTLGWPAITYRSGAADTIILDYDNRRPGGDGVTKRGRIMARGVRYDTVMQTLDLVLTFQNYSVNGVYVVASGPNQLQGKFKQSGDSLSVDCNLQFGSYGNVKFSGYAQVARGANSNRSDDTIRFLTQQGSRFYRVGVASPGSMGFSICSDSASFYMPNLSYPEYGLTFTRGNVAPRTGYLFSTFLKGDSLGDLAYTDGLHVLNDHWSDSLIGPTARQALVDSVFTDTIRHRLGPYGVSGFLDDGNAVMDVNITRDRSDDRFVFVVAYEHGMAADTTASIKLRDVSKSNLDVIDRTVGLGIIVR